MSSSRPGELERFAIDQALLAAWRTEMWNPNDPDYGYSDYFMAAVTRNLMLLDGLSEIAEDIEQRGIVPQPDTAQVQLATGSSTDE